MPTAHNTSGKAISAHYSGTGNRNPVETLAHYKNQLSQYWISIGYHKHDKSETNHNTALNLVLKERTRFIKKELNKMHK